MRRRLARLWSGWIRPRCIKAPGGHGGRNGSRHIPERQRRRRPSAATRRQGTAFWAMRRENTGCSDSEGAIMATKQTRIAYVTGGMGGIGYAICVRLCSEGYTVIAGCGPNSTRKQQWISDMRARGFNVHCSEGNVADWDSTAAAFQKARSEVGEIDILVNNAGITRDGTFRKLTKDSCDAVINTNLNSLFNVTKQVIDGMVDRGWGRIINISSVTGQTGQFAQTNYSTAKPATTPFSMALAQEVAARGVTGNSVSHSHHRPDMRRAGQ